MTDLFDSMEEAAAEREAIKAAYRFCDKDCRDMYDKQSRLDAINGRR